MHEKNTVLSVPAPYKNGVELLLEHSAGIASRARQARCENDLIPKNATIEHSSRNG